MRNLHLSNDTKFRSVDSMRMRINERGSVFIKHSLNLVGIGRLGQGELEKNAGFPWAETAGGQDSLRRSLVVLVDAAGASAFALDQENALGSSFPVFIASAIREHDALDTGFDVGMNGRPAAWPT